MIRIIAKFFVLTIVLTAFLHVGPLSAAPVGYVSSTGSDANPCTAAQPCASFFQASQVWGGSSGEIACLNFPSISEVNVGVSGPNVTFDCAGVLNAAEPNAAPITLQGGTLKIRNLTINGLPGGYPAIKVVGSGSLIIENCVFENFAAGSALDVEPNGAFNLVVTNSRISNSGSGVLIKPAAGGSVTAIFNGVTIADNTGGGLKTDSTNGAIKVDISNSTISNNAGNGLNAVSGASGQNNMLNLSHDVIVSNGSAGIQANGANSAALVDTTLLDSNTAGATSAVAGGRLLTYGNNRIVGTTGSGFTGPAPLQ